MARNASLQLSAQKMVLPRRQCPDATATSNIERERNRIMDHGHQTVRADKTEIYLFVEGLPQK